VVSMFISFSRLYWRRHRDVERLDAHDRKRSPVRRKRGYQADLRHNHPEPQDFRSEEVNVALSERSLMLGAPSAATSQRRCGGERIDNAS
jgi:hypothetical protein